MNEIRLIDANALKEVLKQYFSDGTLDSVSTKLAFNMILRKIDEAPTVKQKEFEQILQPIKVNIPEDIKDKLIEEMSKPRKVILDESKTVQDCIIAYGDGFESARRLFERPHGEWIIDEDCIFENFKKCSSCGEGAEWLDGGSQFLSNFCPNCGADMRKGESE